MVENNLKAIHKDKTPTITKALILFVKGQEVLNLPLQLQLSVSAKAKILLLRESLICMLVAGATA